MAKSQQTFQKKEREKKRLKKKQEKLERREQRKLEKDNRDKLSFEDQLMYLDEHGNVTSKKPDPNKKTQIKAEDISLDPSYSLTVRKSHKRKGKVKFYSEDKAYGFIIDDENGNSIFFHINDAYQGITEQHLVEFEIANGDKGEKAIAVRRV